MNSATEIQNTLAKEQDHNIEELVRKEGKRLFNFIRRSVSDELEAEDLLQDVYFQLVESYRLMKPIEQVSGWLFAVAKNKIRDRFRKKKTIPESQLQKDTETEESDLSLFNQLADTAAGPEGELMREWVMDALEIALDDLPKNQREVFVWHELEGKTFEEISQITGENKNTLISRKRYATLYLRAQLQELYTEFLTD
ncbi:MAG: sigma-70 family RNA polymerase sigma factor [Saprospiraceae bacterium]|nr:sigma-70 family RNA polymerase sigma factor [Saprospiraceae bacterium]